MAAKGPVPGGLQIRDNEEYVGRCASSFTNRARWWERSFKRNIADRSDVRDRLLFDFHARAAPKEAYETDAGESSERANRADVGRYHRHHHRCEQ